MALAGRTLFVTGGSRGIGLSIALRAAADGANIVLAAKTAEPHPKLPGTIYSAAEDVEKAGGKALPVVVDVREEESVQAAIDETMKTFGALDILVNNASAISNTGTLETSMKKYDLMHSINARGTFMTSKLALPHLLESKFNAHVLNLGPPMNMNPAWFAATGTAYTIAKYNMSMCMLGMSEEFRGKVAFNSLWPRTGIATAAIEMLAGKAGMAACRKPEIMADAAHWILTQPVDVTGQCFVDDDVLRNMGMSEKEINAYSVAPGMPLMPDFYVDETPDAFNRFKKAGEMLSKVGKFASGVFK